MYWPTSFCERENSSKRWRISAESVRAVVPVRVTGNRFARAPGVPSGLGSGGTAAGPCSALGMLPDLIVIGAPKGGTTSLHHYLGLHPEIFMSNPV